MSIKSVLTPKNNSTNYAEKSVDKIILYTRVDNLIRKFHCMKTNRVFSPTKMMIVLTLQASNYQTEILKMPI